jgi:hypothetical protein
MYKVQNPVILSTNKVTFCELSYLLLKAKDNLLILRFIYGQKAAGGLSKCALLGK